MSRPSRRAMAARKAWATKRSKLIAVPPTNDLDDIRVKIERGLQLVNDGIAAANEGWDIINSIPKRVT